MRATTGLTNVAGSGFGVGMREGTPLTLPPPTPLGGSFVPPDPVTYYPPDPVDSRTSGGLGGARGSQASTADAYKGVLTADSSLMRDENAAGQTMPDFIPQTEVPVKSPVIASYIDQSVFGKAAGGAPIDASGNAVPKTGLNIYLPIILIGAACLVVIYAK
jgi:hypothetical protein